jgi:hypothetical protein
VPITLLRAGLQGRGGARDLVLQKRKEIRSGVKMRGRSECLSGSASWCAFEFFFAGISFVTFSPSARY